MAERPITEVVDFLFVRIARDEQIAQSCTPGHERWQAFPMDDIAGCSVYDDQWRLLSGTWYDHNNPMSNKPNATGPAYIDTDRIMEHVARHDPARTLAKVAAERRILDAYRDAVARRDYYARDGEEPFVSESRGFVEALEMVIRRLAEVYEAEERTDG